MADTLDELERGRIGHSEAMRFLQIDSYTELVAIAHANGRQMPGHPAMPVAPETLAVLQMATRGF